MKKRVWVLLLVALALSLVFSLASCDLLGNVIGGGGGTQAPTFKSMTVYSTFGSDSNTFAYAEPYESVLITIQLDNPDDLVITSVTISGRNYEVTSFESDSTRDRINIRINVYDAEGIVTYTLESIEYVDGKVLRYVTPTDNNVVRVGVYVADQVAAFVTKEVGFTEITLEVNVKDDNGLIAHSNGSVKAVLSRNGEVIEEKDLIVGNNTVIFEGLAMGKEYNYGIWGHYNDFKYGLQDVFLAGEFCTTNVAVKFDNVVETYDGVDFDLKWHKDAVGYTVSELHLLDGDSDVKLDDATATTVTGLLSNRDYAVVAYYQHRGQTYQVRLDFHTLTKHAPTLSYSNLWVTDDEIRLDLSIADPDRAGSLEVKLDGQKVAVSNQKQIKFSNLTFNQTYDIEISYNYDLNDGEGEHPLSESLTVTVDSQTIHQTSCKLTYHMLDDGTCEVSKNSKCTHQVLSIPATVDGYTVSKINKFSNNSYLTSLILPDTVTAFSSSAFADCKNLTSVTMPSNVAALSDKLFSGCVALADFTIPSSVTSIGNETFYDCPLTSITIPCNVTSIGAKAFRGTNLKTLTFADDSKLTTIGNEAFYNQNQLTTLSIPSSVVSIGDNTFYGCSNLQNVNFDTDSQLKTIGMYAFYRCSGLTEFIIPSTVTSIGRVAFSDCSGITAITIPSSVETIGEQAFSNNRLLQTVTFEADSNLRTIGDGAFSFTGITRITIPKRVISIDAKAFFSCSALSRIDFENGSRLQSIGSSAFYKCTKLSFVNVPAKVGYIGDSAFEESAVSIMFESGSELYHIGNRAFYGCGGISNITIPASVKNIGNYAFNSCIYLRTLTFEANSKLQTIGAYAFGECGTLTTVTIPSSVETIGERAFQNSGLATINYAEDGNLKTIGAYAFEGCKITRIFIPSSVVTLGDGVYKGFSNINAITFEEGSQLQNIGAYAFEGVAITEVVIPATVVTIGDGAFKNCSGLSSFSVEEEGKLQTIGAYFFEGCVALTEVVIPASVTSIGGYAFYNLVNLRSVQFEQGSQLQTIGSSAFSGCSSLLNITLPDGLVEIGTSVFYDCSALQWIIMPTSIKSIGNMAIERGPTTIYYKGNYTQWCRVSMSSGDKNYFQEMYYNVYFYDYMQGYPTWYYKDGIPTPSTTRT